MNSDLNNLIVLNFDGLGARFLGPYGNTWIETPAINHFAAQSILFENAIAQSPNEAQSLWSLMTGKFLASPQQSFAIGDSNFKSAFLTTDDGDILGTTISDWFDETSKLDLPSEENSSEWVRASEWTDCHLAKLFATFASQIADQKTAMGEQPFLACLHSTSLARFWDAPLEIAESFGDEEDPDPFAELLPPKGKFDLETTDPDEFLAFTHSYAAQVSVLDKCIGMLLTILDDYKLFESSTIILTSSFGFPLGEHGFVGTHDDCLFGEQVHVPLLISTPNQDDHARRIHAIVQHHMLGLSFDANETIRQANQIPFAFFTADQNQLVRTPNWSFLRAGGENSLYVKPDDRWELNDVTSRCPEIVREFDSFADQQFPAAIENGTLNFEFDEILVEPID